MRLELQLLNMDSGSGSDWDTSIYLSKDTFVVVVARLLRGAQNGEKTK